MNRSASFCIFLLGLLALPCAAVFAQEKDSFDQPDHLVAVDYDMNTMSRDEIQKENENYFRHLLQEDPEWKNKRFEYEQLIQHHIRESKSNPSVQNVITIPVVFHVIWYDSTMNLPDSILQQQLMMLNEDFSRTNADTGNTPLAFVPFAANTHIQFCLATRDPNGLPTTGIERRQTTIPMFTSYDHPQLYSGGGLNQWDPTRYFNFWICKSIYLGKGEFPTATVSSTYGVILDYAQVCRACRIATHEVGHCFNLYHIWGGGLYNCTDTDFCNDTPNQNYATSGCPTFPVYDSCTSTGDGIMYPNHMDYSACRNFFTKDQSLRMNAVLSVPPYNALAFSNGCQAPLSVEEITETSVKIFPNPASQTVHYLIPGFHPGNAQCELMDLSGCLLMRKKLDADSGVLDLSGLASGVYLLRFTYEGKMIMKRIVKSP